MEYTRGWTNGAFETAPISTITARIDTKGPHNRFGTVLFIEKEGFAPILKDAGIAERYDLAVMSSKGLPVKAACDVVRRLHDQDVKILVARDFDLAGFKIARTMRRGTRLAEGTPITDIGLRLDDVAELESEPVTYSQQKDPRRYLERCGATEAERDFLVDGGDRWRGYEGRRVELNAMTSEQLIQWLESKLEEHGVEKIVPDEETLGRAYRRALFRIEEEKVLAKLAAEMPEADVPDGLAERVRDRLEEYPDESWDEAVDEIASELAGDSE
jgi:hypothetical protein